MLFLIGIVGLVAAMASTSGTETPADPAHTSTTPPAAAQPTPNPPAQAIASTAPAAAEGVPLTLALALPPGPAEPRAEPLLPDAPAVWALTGRLSVRTEKEDLPGRIEWQHAPGRDLIVVSTPLGQTAARIERTPEGVSFEAPNQPRLEAPDIDSLTRRTLGAPVPVSGMQWWVHARPDPARDFAQEFDSQGRIARLRQDGWVIDYLQYAEARPRRIAISREGVDIRLVIDSWQVE